MIIGPATVGEWCVEFGRPQLLCLLPLWKGSVGVNWITDISFALTLYILIHISFLCLCYRWIIQVGSTTVVEYGKISDEMPKLCQVCLFVFQFCTNPSPTIVGVGAPVSASQMWSMVSGR